MPQFTRNAIIACTLSLAEKKPFNKITIRDIVEGCGITRNTFYYYFHDIFDVFDQIIAEKAEEIGSREDGDVRQAMTDFVLFCLSHKKVWQNLYRSVGREEMARYIVKRMHPVLVQFVQAEAKEDALSEQDLHIVVTFYEEAIVGVFFRWLNNDKQYNTEEALQSATTRIRVLFSGQIRLIVENSKKKK